MTKKEVTPELSAMMQTLGRRIVGVKGNAAITKLQNRTKADPAAAQFIIGDEIYVSEDPNDVFVTSFNGREAAGVIVAVKTASGQTTAKSLYFSALDRDVPEYDEAGQTTGNIVHAKNETSKVYDAIKACTNDSEIYNSIKGKSLKVVAINPANGARFDRGGNVVGTRKRNVPVFDWA